VLVGNSGGELGVRGWLTALDVNTGKLAWRAYSTGPDKNVLIGDNFKPLAALENSRRTVPWCSASTTRSSVAVASASPPKASIATRSAPAMGILKASGLRWLSVMLVPIPWAERIWALPFLTALAPCERHNLEHGRRHKELTEWGRQVVLQARRWLPGREMVLVADSSFAALDFLAALVCHGVLCITRLRLEAALHDPAPPRLPGALGRPRTKGKRLPNLSKVLIDADTLWQHVLVPGWHGGGERAVDLCSGPAVQRHAGLPLVPIRWVLVRDPLGRFDPQALLCTDPNQDPHLVPRWFVQRWQLETTFQQTRAHPGGETRRQWSGCHRTHHPLPARAILSRDPARRTAQGTRGRYERGPVSQTPPHLQRHARRHAATFPAGTGFAMSRHPEGEETPPSAPGRHHPCSLPRRPMAKVEVRSPDKTWNGGTSELYRGYGQACGIGCLVGHYRAAAVRAAKPKGGRPPIPRRAARSGRVVVLQSGIRRERLSRRWVDEGTGPNPMRRDKAGSQRHLIVGARRHPAADRPARDRQLQPLGDTAGGSAAWPGFARYRRIVLRHGRHADIFQAFPHPARLTRRRLGQRFCQALLVRCVDPTLSGRCDPAGLGMPSSRVSTESTLRDLDSLCKPAVLELGRHNPLDVHVMNAICLGWEFRGHPQRERTR
jgi:hypothetical protein